MYACILISSRIDRTLLWTWLVQQLRRNAFYYIKCVGSLVGVCLLFFCSCNVHLRFHPSPFTTSLAFASTPASSGITILSLWQTWNFITAIRRRLSQVFVTPLRIFLYQQLCDTVNRKLSSRHMYFCRPIIYQFAVADFGRIKGSIVAWCVNGAAFENSITGHSLEVCTGPGRLQKYVLIRFQIGTDMWIVADSISSAM